VSAVGWAETRGNDGPSDHGTLRGLDDGRDGMACGDYSRSHEPFAPGNLQHRTRTARSPTRIEREAADGCCHRACCPHGRHYLPAVPLRLCVGCIEPTRLSGAVMPARRAAQLARQATSSSNAAGQDNADTSPQARQYVNQRVGAEQVDAATREVAARRPHKALHPTPAGAMSRRGGGHR